MNIEDIENLNLCCGYCKSALVYYNNSVNYFAMECSNINCNKGKTLSGSFESNNNIIVFFRFSLENGKTFYFENFNIRGNLYKKSIKLSEEDFLILLKDYSKDFDIEKLENKFDTLELFL